MKAFRIPLVDMALRVYVGAREWRSFLKAVTDHGAAREDKDDPKEPPGKGSGRSWGGWVWVEGLEDTNCLVHELSHFLTDTMAALHSEDGEFRAYITGWVVSAVLEWAAKKIPSAEATAKRSGAEAADVKEKKDE